MRDIRRLLEGDIFDLFILSKRQFERNQLYSLIKDNAAPMIDWNNEIHIAASYEETEFWINSIVVDEKDKLIFSGTGIDGCSIEFSEDDFVDTEFGDILNQLAFKKWTSSSLKPWYNQVSRFFCAYCNDVCSLQRYGFSIISPNNLTFLT